MRLLPNRLFYQTALLFAFLLILVQLIWIAIGSLFLVRPLKTEFVQHLADEVTLVRMYVSTAPPQVSGVIKFQGGLILYTGDAARTGDTAPGGEFPAEIQASLRELAGPDVHVRWASQDYIEVRLTASGQACRLLVPAQSPQVQPFPLPLLAWVLIAVGMAAGGAYLLIAQLNRRLHRVVEGVRSLGRGIDPGPLPEEGPDEIRELSRGFNQMNAGLQRMDAERRVMLAGISHDLRTPLARLRLGLELNTDVIRPDHAAGMVQDIEQIDSILMQFLDYVRDKKAEEVQPCNLDELVEEVCARYRVAGHDIRFNLGRVPTAMWQTVSVRRLVTNLVQNAVQYGRVGIEVSTACNGAEAVLTVADRGPGVQVRDPDELLRPFAREDVSRSIPGSGLGLAVAERVARAHGGSLQLANRPGGGFVATATMLIYH